MLTQLGTVILKVTDIRLSTTFYHDILGLPIRFDSAGWVEFDLPGTTLALHPAPAEFREHVGKNGVTVNFLVEDVKRIATDLRARGAPGDLTVIDEDFGKFLEVIDPDGYAIGICQLRRK
ncbi:MAG: methylmalonyl-CoA epimerase [Planctomycetes bacterium]|nr:methylmalonyl-CoA epimerase [Planctomycetota bacterium]